MSDLIDYVLCAGDDAGALQADEPGPGREDVSPLITCQQLAGVLVPMSTSGIDPYAA